jgi:16S rRNA (guanine966-N2)-methyltransferase
MQRTKESLFSSLGAGIDGVVFADLFAGAGAVGIEALSRGARCAHFVEHGPDSLRSLRENIARLEIGAERACVHSARVADVLRARPCPIAEAEIVFADAPYDLDLAVEMLGVLNMEACPGLRRLIVEHRARMPAHPGPGLRVERTRRFGETMLTYFVPDRGEGAEEEDQ